MVGDIANFSVSIMLILVFIIATIAFLLVNLVFTFPLIGIYFGIKHAKRKKELEKRTYNSEEDILYYRDVLKDITPTDMSLLVNLEIEEKKDMAATILDLYSKNLIQIIDNKIVITNDDMMREKDLTLVKGIENGINSENIKTWKEKSLNEAINKNLIMKKYGKNKLYTQIIILIISVILFFTVPNVINNMFVKESILDNPVVAEKVENMSDKEFLNSEYFLETVIEIGKNATGVIILALIFILPIYSLIFIIRYKTLKDKLKRTVHGEELTEKVAAIYKFVHDFTNLNVAAKERIILWKDFLVYAVVLEENEIIVEDICNSYNVNYSLITNMIK